jgi:hemerythrin superfamily protein
MTPVERFLAQDHDRLDRWLTHALRNPDEVDEQAYEEFRRGLLQHIAMEEKVLFPAIADLQGEPHPDYDRLHKDHGWIAHMLTIRPTPYIISELKPVLERHNEMEEKPEGIYAACWELSESQAEQLVQRMRDWPAVKVAPYRRG